MKECLTLSYMKDIHHININLQYTGNWIKVIGQERFMWSRQEDRLENPYWLNRSY